jgi:hypothetical protein
MAQTPVTLFVDGFKEREVQAFSYSFNQAVDKENQPSGIPRGGQLKITVKAHNSGTPELMHWMLVQDMKKKGKLQIMQSNDVKTKMKDIEFEDAYCVDYKEEWLDDIKGGNIAHIEVIILSCKMIKNQQVSFENEWK